MTMTNDLNVSTPAKTTDHPVQCDASYLRANAASSGRLSPSDWTRADVSKAAMMPVELAKPLSKAEMAEVKADLGDEFMS